jgi:hypothetical protein
MNFWASRRIPAFPSTIVTGSWIGVLFDEDEGSLLLFAIGIMDIVHVSFSSSGLLHFLLLVIVVRAYLPKVPYDIS